MSRTTPRSEDTTPTRREIADDVRSLSSSPLLYVGAITIGVSSKIVSLSGLIGLEGALATFVVALALLWGQLAVLSYFGWTSPNGRC
jgi:hypothetical protein